MVPGVVVKLMHAQFFDIRLNGRIIIIIKTTDKIFNTRLDTLTRFSIYLYQDNVIYKKKNTTNLNGT